jgi:hypothetical protein
VLYLLVNASSHPCLSKAPTAFQQSAAEKRQRNSGVQLCLCVPLAVRIAAHDARRWTMDNGAAVPRSHANGTIRTLSGMLLHRGGTGFGSFQWGGERTRWDHVCLESMNFESESID